MRKSTYEQLHEGHRKTLKSGPNINQNALGQLQPQRKSKPTSHTVVPRDAKVQPKNKKLEMLISTSVWNAQHPNAGQNIQHFREKTFHFISQWQIWWKNDLKGGLCNCYAPMVSLQNILAVQMKTIIFDSQYITMLNLSQSCFELVKASHFVLLSKLNFVLNANLTKIIIFLRNIVYGYKSLSNFFVKLT